MKKQSGYDKNPIRIKIQVRGQGYKYITLYPQKTYQVINNQESYDIIRTFKIVKE